MTVSANVKQVDDTNFDEEVLAADLPVLVDFVAPWCPPCRAMEPVIARLAEETEGRVKIVTVNTEASPRIAVRYGIRAVPTLLVFRRGDSIPRYLGGPTKEKLLALVDRQSF